jgi:hypothetical protein
MTLEQWIIQAQFTVPRPHGNPMMQVVTVEGLREWAKTHLEGCLSTLDNRKDQGQQAMESMGRA